MPLVLDPRLSSMIDALSPRSRRVQPVFVVGSDVGSTVVFPGCVPGTSNLVASIASVGQWCTKSPSAGDHSTTGVSGYAFWLASIAIVSGARAVHRVQPMHF